MAQIVRWDKDTLEPLCFRHAVLRAVNGKTIVEMEFEHYQIVANMDLMAKCVDCEKNKNSEDKRNER